MSEIKNIKTLFEAFKKQKALIIGDIMLDSYIWGKAERLSPEAPVPVVSVEKKELRPGGAANVALNIQALGAKPVLCSVIGNDEGGRNFLKLLHKYSISSAGILKLRNRITTVKTRIIGNNHHLLRIDEEISDELSAKESLQFTKLVIKVISDEKPDVIIFEDYDKGALNRQVIEDITLEAIRKKIPVAVDPKKRNFIHYKNADLFKPNLQELKAGLKMDMDGFDQKAVKAELKKFCSMQMIKMIMVTLSEAGIFFSANGRQKMISAHVRNISDVSGAGDTVISTAALCLSLGVPPETIAALANLAGGIVCEKTGVVPINAEQLMNEASGMKIH